MDIKHMPSGLFPHFDCGFQRNPYYPVIGEEVHINCRIDGAMPETNVWIEWHIDGIEQLRIDGEKIEKENDQRIFYTFCLGSFDQKKHIDYKIVAKMGLAITMSKEYSFEVLKKISFNVPEKILVEDGHFWVQFENEGLKPVLQIDIDKSIRLRVFSSPSGMEIKGQELISSISIKITDEFIVTVSCKPFGLSIERNGMRIGGIKGDEFFFDAYADRSDRIYIINQNLLVNGKAFYGFGEKFDKVNQKGLEPLSHVVEEFSNQQDKTYFPVPFFFTETGLGFYRNSSYKLKFRLNESIDSDLTNIKLEGLCPRSGLLVEDFLMVGTPDNLIKTYHQLTGFPILPPKWCFGPWISSNGWNTQEEALEQIEYMNKYKISSTVMVLEAWSDEENFYIFNDAKYIPNDSVDSFSYKDFEFNDQGKWPDPRKFTEELKKNNIKLILWQIPVIKYAWRNNGKQLNNDEAFAVEKGYCIKNDDGTPYRVTENWFNTSLMPDFTNPAAAKWWFEKRQYLITELGVAGFKTDGGEFMFDDTTQFYNGKNGEEMHNLYPNLYIGAYHEFLEKYLGKGNGITFSRAGFSGGQKYPIHWAGDQVSSFSELKGQLTSGLSAGLSGIPFWGFDIGGFAGALPSTELYLRSVAFGAFAPVMQFHSEPRSGQYYRTERNHWNNDRSPWNLAKANNDETILPQYRKFANIRMNLLPYIYNEAMFCVQKSRPLMAHLIYDYPNDGGVINIEDEYMFGRYMLVAPILEEGKLTREIYLPEGEWFDFWEGTLLQGGCRIQYQCNIDKIPVFIKAGSILPCNLSEKYILGAMGIEGYVGNKVNQYEKLCLVTYGDGEYEFKDDLKNTILCHVLGNRIALDVDGGLDQLAVVSAIGTSYSEFYINGKLTTNKDQIITLFERKNPGHVVEI